jgi:hypothetical protein
MSGRGRLLSNKDTNERMSEHENEPEWAVRISESLANLTHTVNDLTHTVNENHATSQANHANLTHTVNENHANLTHTVNGNHAFVKQTAFPLGTSGLNLAPECLENSPLAAFTWIGYPHAKTPMIVGSAHCAIPLHVLSLQHNNYSDPNFVFVELPQPILKRNVLHIFLLDPYATPYTPGFVNPLPVKNDLIAIDVQHKLDSRVKVPSYDSSVVPAGVYQTYKECHVVGQSQNSYVNSKGGLLTLDTNADGTGTMSFVLDVGQPGQSGTSLFVQNTAGTRTGFKAVAIFHGVLPKTNQYATPQGVAAILPPFERLTSLRVSDVFQGVDSPSLTLHLADNGICTVTSAASTHGFASVKLMDANSSIKYGVFVRTTKNIPYAGYKDWAVMPGSGTPAPLSFGRKRSFDETDWSEEL